jgi:hypothetical protein
MAGGAVVTHSHSHPVAPGPDDTTGAHGMLLFGERQTYLSHLPMVDPPHNYQVLLAVRPDAEASRALRADSELSPGVMHTVDPELFPITALDPAAGGLRRTSLRGTVFHGHFERRGHPIARDVTFEISRVVYFQRLELENSGAAPGELEYLCFGEPGELFLAHRISTRPSFDSVLSVEMVHGSVTTMAGSSLEDDVTAFGFELAQPLTRGRQDDVANRLVPGETVTAIFPATPSLSGAHGFRAQLRVGDELYLEVKELS